MCRVCARVSTYMTWIIIFLPSWLVTSSCKGFFSERRMPHHPRSLIYFLVLCFLWYNPCVLYTGTREIRNIRGTITGMHDEMCALSRTGNLVSPITNVVSKYVSAQWYYRTSMIAFISEMLELSYIRHLKWRKRCIDV